MTRFGSGKQRRARMARFQAEQLRKARRRRAARRNRGGQLRGWKP